MSILAGLIAPAPVTQARAATPPPAPIAKAAVSFSGMVASGGSTVAPNLQCLPEECGDPDPCGWEGCLPPPPPPSGCNAYLQSQGASRGDNPELGGPYSHVQFSSQISCFNGPYAVSMRAKLWDRSEDNDGYDLADGSLATYSTGATSSGAVDLYDVHWYPYAQVVEQVQVFELAAGPGGVWAPCNTPSGARILWCNGVGTSTLSVGVGWMPFGTGVAVAADCNHKDDRTLQWVRDGVVAVYVTAHVQWCTYANGRVKEVKQYKPTDLFKKTNSGVGGDICCIEFHPTYGDPATGWTTEDGWGHYKVMVYVGINSGRYPWCTITIEGDYIGSHVDHSSDYMPCSSTWTG